MLINAIEKKLSRKRDKNAKEVFRQTPDFLEFVQKTSPRR